MCSTSRSKQELTLSYNLPVWPVLSKMTSFFAGMSSSGTAKSTVKRSETIKHLYEQVHWNDLIKAEILRQRDYQLIVRSHDNLDLILDNANDSSELGRILMKIAGNPNDTIVTKYAFYRTEEILGISKEHDANSACGIHLAKIFTYGGTYLNDASLVKSLLSPDPAIQQSAGLIFAHLLNVYEGSTDRLKEWIISKLVSAAEDAWEIAIPALSTFTRNNSARKAELVEAGVVLNIVSILKTLDFTGQTQQLYELCFVLWTLSLGDIDHASFLHAGAIPVLVDILAAAPSRKVVRMSLASLRNLSATENDSVLNELFTAFLPKVLDVMSHHGFLKTVADDEAEQDFKFLTEVLNRNFRELSSYDRWTSQVYSGSLRWGIVHTEKFWRENVRFVEADNFKALRALIALLDDKDPTVVCVALYDIGEFTRFYPNGRVVVSRLGAKETIMKMMESDNAEIQRHTLQCISKIMVTNWEFLR